MSNEDISGSTPEVNETEAAKTASVSEKDVNTSVSSTEESQGVKAESPSAKAPDVKDEKPISMLDKVKSILSGKKEAKAESSKAESEETEKSEKVEVEKTEAEKPKEAQADKPAEAPKEFAKHPAWQRILRERDTYKEESAQYRKIDGFLKETGVSGADAAKSLQMAALIYQNPQEAYKQLTTLVSDLAVRIGAALPEDLKKDVDEGHLSEDRAKELSKARMDATNAQYKVQATEERLVQSDNQRQIADRVRAFEAWEQAVSKTDPDLAKKLPIMEGILLKMNATYGEPKGTQDVMDRLAAAHREVTNQIRSLIPARVAKEASPRNPGSAATVKTAPTSMLEVVQSKLNASRRA